MEDCWKNSYMSSLLE